MQKIYLPTVKNIVQIPLIFFVLLVMGLTGKYWGDVGNDPIQQEAFWGLAKGMAFLAFLACFLFMGSRFVIDNKSIKWILGFFIPIGIAEHEIKIYKGNMIDAAPMPAIIIEHRGLFGLKRKLRMNIEFFTEQTVSQFLSDLHDFRPDIPMDAACKKLIEKRGA